MIFQWFSIVLLVVAQVSVYMDFNKWYIKIMSNLSAFIWYLTGYNRHNITIDMQGFTSQPSVGKNPGWPTKIATNEHFRSGFRNGNNQNFFLDTFRIPNMYVKKMCSSGVGEVTSLLYY